MKRLVCAVVMVTLTALAVAAWAAGTGRKGTVTAVPTAEAHAVSKSAAPVASTAKAPFVSGKIVSLMTGKAGAVTGFVLKPNHAAGKTSKNVTIALTSTTKCLMNNAGVPVQHLKAGTGVTVYLTHHMRSGKATATKVYVKATQATRPVASTSHATTSHATAHTGTSHTGTPHGATSPTGQTKATGK